MMNTMMKSMTRPFMGPEVNGGTVGYMKDGGQRTLVLSDDFKTPDAPAPHWQVVDTTGNAYLLRRLETADGKFNKTQVLPGYVKDVSAVRIYCAFAEVVLGEARFETPLM